MHRLELENNTDEQIRGYLRRSLELVEELNPPDDLRPALLAAAVVLVSSKQVIVRDGPAVVPGGLVPGGRG